MIKSDIHPGLIFIGIIVILVTIYLYYRISKSRRANALSRIGFEIITDVRRREKNWLAKLVPEWFSHPGFLPGTYGTYGGLYVSWIAKKKIKGGKLICVTFRKTEAHRSRPAELWYVAIIMEGVKASAKNIIVNNVQRGYPQPVDIVVTEDRISIFYKRPIFSFNYIRRCLRSIEDMISNY